MDNPIGVVHVDSHSRDSRTYNSISQFTNYLPCSYSFSQGEYEVALTEIQYPQSWYNLRKDAYICLFNSVGDYEAMKMIEIKKGHYETIDDLLAEINRKMYEFFVPATAKGPEEAPDLMKTIAWYGYDNRIRLHNFHETIGNVNIIFSYDLALLLGFTNDFFVAMPATVYETRGDIVHDEITKLFPDVKLSEVSATKLLGPDGKIHPKHSELYSTMRFRHKLAVPRISRLPYDITGGLDKIFVHTNLIKPATFGNQSKQILRVIPVYRQDLQHFGQNITRSFLNPFFFPLFINTFDQIDIELRDRLGRLIDFVSGSCIVTLEFRKRQDGQSLF